MSREPDPTGPRQSMRQPVRPSPRLAAAGPAPLSWERPGVLVAAAAAFGLLQAMSIAPTPLWYLQMASVAGLAWLVRSLSPWRSAVLGWAFGVTWLTGSVWWLYVSMHRYGGLPSWMAAAAVLALCGALSIYLGAAMWLHARGRTGQPLLDGTRFAAVWLLAELARAVLFTGFPWAASGYAHVDGPLASLAPWVGVYGIGAAAAWIGAVGALLVAHLGRPRWAIQLGVAVAIAGLAAVALRLGPSDFTRPTGTLDVTLLQGNVPQDEKFETHFVAQALQWHVETMLAARADLVVAPETAVPLLPDQLPPDLWPGLVDRFRDGNRLHALFGVPLGSYEDGYTNSVVGLAPHVDREYRYDKHHLVPFGEFIPPGFHWFVEMMNMPLGDFNRGPVVAPSFPVKGERIGPNICYEDLFGEELARRFVAPGDAPTVFANVSNIAWFGDTVAVPQHLQISRMRTLELQRPMLRATNTGATAIIDYRGVVTASLPPFTRGVLEGQVQGRTGNTPYAEWAGHLRLWPLFGAAVLVLLAGWVTASRGRREPGPSRP